MLCRRFCYFNSFILYIYHHLTSNLHNSPSQSSDHLQTKNPQMKGHDLINLILPDELILEIFHNLDSKSSRDACSLVCRRWLTLERFSRDTIRIGASGSPDALVHILARRFPNVTNVYIDERLSVSLPVDFVCSISPKFC